MRLPPRFESQKRYRTRVENQKKQCPLPAVDRDHRADHDRFLPCYAGVDNRPVRRQQPRQWGLSRYDAAPRNPHHCSTNCRDTTDARNTPWMGNKWRDIPEPDILRAVGMVEHCNSQHSVVLVEMGRMPRDQQAEPRPGLL